MARDLGQRYGMSKKVGPVSYGEHGEMVFLGKELGVEKNYSNETAAMIDKEVTSFMKKAFDRARSIIKTRRDKLEELAQYLISHETIERDEFARLMAA